MAVAFLFEIDSLAYECLISPASKMRYRQSMSPLPTRLAKACSPDTAFYYSFVFMVVDFCFMLMLYVYEAWTLLVVPVQHMRNANWHA